MRGIARLIHLCAFRLRCLDHEASAIPALAQLAPPRTLDELKQEIQARADRRAYPVSQLDPAEVREALANLKSQERDHWAAVWSAIGDRHLAKAKSLEATDKPAAAKAYEHAMEYYLFARFPLEDSPGTAKAYEKVLESFAGYGRTIDPPIEAVTFTYDGKDIVGYLRKPKGVTKPPVVMTIGGLDGRKENAVIRNAGYLAHGVAFFALDMPGTGQTRITISPAPKASTPPRSMRSPSATISTAKRIVVYGGSWGGHWSARLAYSAKDRIRGAVVQGGPVHGYSSRTGSARRSARANICSGCSRPAPRSTASRRWTNSSLMVRACRSRIRAGSTSRRRRCLSSTAATTPRCRSTTSICC